MKGKKDHQLFKVHEHASERDLCPKCGELDGGEMMIRHGKRGLFLGCHRYPDCDHIQPLHNNDGHVVKWLGVPCPDCGEELVLRQGRYGMFIGCSRYPKCHHIESLEQPQEKEKMEEICCPECNSGLLVERKSRFGKVFWACGCYPKCKFAVNQPPVNGKCGSCHFSLLTKKETAQGIKYQCADRKCHHIQSELI